MREGEVVVLQNDLGSWELWADGALVCDTFRTEAEAWARWEDVEWHGRLTHAVTSL